MDGLVHIPFDVHSVIRWLVSSVGVTAVFRFGRGGWAARNSKAWIAVLASRVLILIGVSRLPGGLTR